MTLLFLNGIGTGEVLVIVLFVLLFFGSKRIPEFARSLGKGLRQFKDATNDIQRDITDSVREVNKEINKKD